ncbi:hypothetical protein EDB81DRAFT_901232 [Dactylonectria macrodidyma]|uniref:Major facilitator superfamily (MFS) profile domain-containing protein n=1 Tax=Dactylonectria macrodidyma TaxID=307937 RepID=A0A9P9EJ65_9HYPO|nr:hypothetical protein EDB81DRAFT_901232 [Dactylonectria macrodidyma]
MANLIVARTACMFGAHLSPSDADFPPKKNERFPIFVLSIHIHAIFTNVSWSVVDLNPGARSKGMALATCSNWMFNFVIGMSAPDAFAGIGGYYYVIIAGFCLISVALAYFFYVETANHTLEEIALAFGDKAFAADDETVVATAHLGRETEERKSALV